MKLRSLLLATFFLVSGFPSYAQMVPGSGPMVPVNSSPGTVPFGPANAVPFYAQAGNRLTPITTVNSSIFVTGVSGIPGWAPITPTCIPFMNASSVLGCDTANFSYDSVIQVFFALQMATTKTVTINPSDPTSYVSAISAPATYTPWTWVYPTTVGGAGQPLISGGDGVTPNSWGTLTGNTSAFTTASGTVTGTTNLTSWDGSGNVIDSSLPLSSVVFAASDLDAGTPDARLITTFTPYALTANSVVAFTSNFTNTGVMTVNVNGLGDVRVYVATPTGPLQLQAGEMVAGNLVLLAYDGTNFQYLNPIGSTGTVNTGTVNQMAWYAATGSTVSGLPTLANGVLSTNGSGVPSISDTPTIGTSVTVPTIYGGTGASSILNLRSTSSGSPSSDLIRMYTNNTLRFILNNAGEATFSVDVVSPLFALEGITSGVISILGQANSGTYNFNLPTTAGTSGHPLLSGGGGTSPMTYGSLSGNTSTFVTTTGSLTSGTGVEIDGSGNFISTGYAPAPVYQATDGGTANAHVISSFGFTLQADSLIVFTATATNTGSTTADINGVGAKLVTKQSPGGVVALEGGEWVIGNTVVLSYDLVGNRYQLINPPDQTQTFTYTTSGSSSLTLPKAAKQVMACAWGAGAGGGSGAAPGAVSVGGGAGGGGMRGCTPWFPNPQSTFTISVGAGGAGGGGGIVGGTSGLSGGNSSVFTGSGVYITAFGGIFGNAGNISSGAGGDGGGIGSLLDSANNPLKLGGASAAIGPYTAIGSSLDGEMGGGSGGQGGSGTSAGGNGGTSLYGAGGGGAGGGHTLAGNGNGGSGGGTNQFQANFPGGGGGGTAGTACGNGGNGGAQSLSTVGGKGGGGGAACAGTGGNGGNGGFPGGGGGGGGGAGTSVGSGGNGADGMVFVLVK